MPTLAESNAQRPIAGTSHYQEAILAAAGGRQDDGPIRDLVMAQLAVVGSGPYAGAVGVYLAGRRAGAIKHDNALAYQPVLTDLDIQGLPAMCRAAIYGGHRLGSREWANFGVALLQPARPTPAGEGAPFLPPVVGMRVSVPQLLAETLDAAIPSRAKRHVHRCSGVLDPRSWVLLVDGQTVGGVEFDHDLQTAMLQAAAAAGFPLTCAVRMVREPDRELRVAVDIPISPARGAGLVQRVGP